MTDPTPLRSLALETSTRRSSVALLQGEQLVAHRVLPSDQRTAQALAPAIDLLLREAHWRADQLQMVAVTDGPGSFTGLRIGVTTAKALAYALDTHIVAVDTLEVIAHQAPPEATPLEVVLDAYRGQLFAASFERAHDGRLQCRQPSHVVDGQQWLARLPADVWLSGPVLRRLTLPDSVHQTAPAGWEPDAATLGQLAHRAHQSGRRDDLWTLAPRYLRASAAEEKWEQRGER